VLHATGDALNPSVSAYSNAGSEADDWSMRVGDHHDGMDLYFIDDKGGYTERDTGRAVLVVNHESSADSYFLHPNGQTSGGSAGKKFTQFGDWDLGARPELEVLKEMNLHGVSVVEIRRVGQGWQVQVGSPLNRRITPMTPMRIAGPRVHINDVWAFTATRWETAGSMSRGTLNNCAMGRTPWGSYLTCEENWDRYFQFVGTATLSANETASRRRYGLPVATPAAGQRTAGGQGWHTVSASDDRFARWNLAPSGRNAEADFRNEANTFGFVVEIDPLNPNSTPVKRVAMGRLAHEGAVCSVPKAGQPLAFYMGCDSRNEYIYKFVSAAPWDPQDVGRGTTAGDKYLNEGRLFVAKFNADGQGDWIELSIADPRIAGYAPYRFANQADVFLNTRLAADAVGATKMDRPEWGP